MPQQKIALVTGGNKGIGFEVCRQLGSKGHKVILTSRNEERGLAAAETLLSEGLDIVYRNIEVTSKESVDAAADWLSETYGRLDILVNNAGIAIDQFVPGLTVDPDVANQTFQTNVMGVLHVSQAFIPIIQSGSRGGSVVKSSQSGGRTSSDRG